MKKIEIKKEDKIRKANGEVCPACGGILEFKKRTMDSSSGYGEISNEIRECQNCFIEYEVAFESYIVENSDDELIGRVMELQDGTAVRILENHLDKDTCIAEFFPAKNYAIDGTFEMEKEKLSPYHNDKGELIKY